MPDWSYRTVLRPLLFALGAERGRRLAVSTLRTMGRLPLGLRAIDFLGHMRADPRLQTRAGAVALEGPIALGARIDPAGDALAAFSRFGVGLIEVGPVVDDPPASVTQWRVDLQQRTIAPDTGPAVSVEDVARNLERAAPRAPVAVHIGRQDGAAVRRIVARLQDHAALFIVDAANVDDALGLRPVLTRDTVHERAAGVWMRGDPEAVRASRGRLRPEAMVIAAGATEPAEVRALLDAGADVATIDAGLVCSGPGLIKRCNEALLSRDGGGDSGAVAAPLFTLDAAQQSWFWALLMGVAMFAGGVLAVIIASTRVVLPYDESLCGLTRAQMITLNPRLLPFMAHDRISLAGSMLSIGIFYAALAWEGIRRGSHWAHVTIVLSALAGFFSFFSFLGFGYFDPFHAFVTAILTQFLLLCMVMQRTAVQRPADADWRESAAWRRGQWGQLLFILLGIGLTVAGLVTTVIGCTRVFVASDLAFMRTTAAQFHLSYDGLVPLVAHDRATLGGMLVANGIAVWLAAQWGFRAGTRWLWRALAWGGNLAFVCAIAVHLVVGYSEVLHLAPALLGWVLWSVALVLTRGWMCGAAAQGP